MGHAEIREFFHVQVKAIKLREWLNPSLLESTSVLSFNYELLLMRQLTYNNSLHQFSCHFLFTAAHVLFNCFHNNVIGHLYLPFLHRNVIVEKESSKVSAFGDENMFIPPKGSEFHIV
jgi:hypothetical protein